MKRWLVAAFFALLPGELMAAPKIITADAARAAQEAGEIVLIDIRQPQEWADGGMPAGAVPLTMQDPQFGPKLMSILERAGERRIALICRTGGRTAYLAGQLEQAGLTDIIDVSEGVYGSGAGPGWLQRGLPVELPGPETFEDRLKALSGE